MKITQLSIHNFLKLKDVIIDPKKVNIIVGKNKQGKTSILKAIQVAFTGKADEKMIHDSESKAEIVIDLDEYRIKRDITKKGNYLEVSNKDGWKLPAPQKFLDGLIGQFSFNPIEFFNLKSSDKKKYLLQAIDINLTSEMLNDMLGEKVDVDLNRHGLEVIAELYKHYYSLRTQKNASVSRLEKTYDQLFGKVPKDFDRSQTSAELAGEIEVIRKSITANELVKKDKLENDRNIASLVTSIDDDEKEIIRLQAKVEDKKTKLAELREATFEIVDTSELEKQLAELESKRETITIVGQLQESETELTSERAEQSRLDSLVKKLSKEIPDKLIAAADLPVEGLKVEEDSVSLNNVDIDQLSASEQLTFALQVVRKLNGQFKIVCIDGVEILDKETFEWFCNEIEKDDFQYFVTRVDGDKGLIVENGEIKKDESGKEK